MKEVYVRKRKISTVVVFFVGEMLQLIISYLINPFRTMLSFCGYNFGK